MSFCALPVFLAFILNRLSIIFFTSCRCILGFSPFSSSLLFGFSLVVILLKHPELYPFWLRPINCKMMFFYELFASLAIIEIGFCMWNSLETFLFYKVPAFLEEHCSSMGELYIRAVETDVGVSVISNMMAILLLMFTLHTTRVCNFNLLFRNNGVHKFFADAGLTTKPCRHNRDPCKYSGNVLAGKQGFCSPRPTSGCRPCILPKNIANGCGPKTLRSGKIFY